jgi:WD40 repeat protein
MDIRGSHLFWRITTGCLALALLAACGAPGLGPTPGSEHGNIPTSTPTQPIATPSPTPTYPCPQATQELPPRVAPLTSPTTELSQVIHILPGNYDQATVETESGTFTAAFKGADGAQVKVTLFPNTVHHLTVTVTVHKSTEAYGCTYGGYTMTTFVDQNGKPLEIVQGAPATPSPVSEALGPQNVGRLKLLASVSLTDRQRAWSAIFAADDTLLTFGFGQGVYRWQAPSGEALGEQLLNQEWMTTSAALSPDGNWMASGSGGYDSSDNNQTSVRLWNLKSGDVRLLGHHQSVVESLAFNPSSTLLASGGNEGAIFVWDVSSGKQVATFSGEAAKLSNGSTLIQGIRQLFWTDDSTVLARGDAVVYAWKVPSGERLLELPGEYTNIDFSAAQNLLAAVREDGVYLGEGISGKLLALDNSQGFTQVAFSPDGKILAGLNAQTIAFWDTATKKLLASATNPAGAPMVFSPDWRYLAQINWEKQNFSLWGVQP